MVHCCTLLQHYEGAQWIPYCHSSRPIGDWENDGSDSSPFNNRFAHCVLWHKVWYMIKVYTIGCFSCLFLVIIIGKWLFYHRYIRVHAMDSNYKWLLDVWVDWWFLRSYVGSSAALYRRGTNVFLLERVELSSLPFGIDDPPKGQKGSDISDLVIDLYQGGKTANLRKGAVCPKSLPLVASNFNIRSEARYA